jgi:hypothetical protein
MVNINIFAVSLMGVLILLDLALTFYVLPKNWREVRRSKNEYSPLKWTLLTVTLSMILFSIIPIAYQTTRLDVPTESINIFRALSSSSVTLLVLSFMVGWVSIHALSDILIRRDKKKEE